MTQETPLPEQDQPSQKEPQINYDLFVVLDQPKVMWTIDSRDEQVSFLKALRPDYWRYLAETHGPAAEDATSPHQTHAQILLKTAMAQANETLFTLVAAFIQSPECPLGWSLSYNNSQLCTVVDRINNGEPLPNVMGEERVTWEKVATAVMRPFSSNTSTTMEEHTQNLVRALRLLARQHTDENLKHEYNSIKHGTRLGAGGTLSLEIRPHGEDSGFSVGASKVSRFHVVESISKNSPHFTINERHQNWDGEKMYGTLMVTAALIEVFRAALLAMSGEGFSGKIAIPDSDTLNALIAPNKSAGGLIAFRVTPLSVATIVDILDEEPMDVNERLKKVYQGTWIPKSEKPKPQQ